MDFESIVLTCHFRPTIWHRHPSDSDHHHCLLSRPSSGIAFMFGRDFFHKWRQLCVSSCIYNYPIYTLEFVFDDILIVHHGLPRWRAQPASAGGILPTTQFNKAPANDEHILVSLISIHSARICRRFGEVLKKIQSHS
jgi:hypothetical protein